MSTIVIPPQAILNIPHFSEKKNYKGLVAGFRYQKQEVLVEKHPVITGARRGDLIRVIRFVEDRHGLGVQSFQMTLLH